ncbi:hypothetical protein LXA47_20155 [Massilia sp. P8910]|nr:MULTISPECIES: hypothetical protein [Massilia]MCE3605899.1 hypothetical protein [Massilia antarctica]MCY0910968.1 hypothetical protein [Massilia sp. H27-R4]CUI09760.1 hypothetical protein BN2497_14297 [Janthinobacterium sp. CG23_2]CUU33546.1 hypothetical protein BN3177_14297 [Janthinobacterium sp. CG23_2]
MRRLLAYFAGLFGARSLAEDDPLTGAVDLSDAAYCLGLLPGDSEL